jgi:NAD(P)H-hydrate repair Nnr-like enzyme with NAD(P)H-hydrate dehydratase domain
MFIAGTVPIRDFPVTIGEANFDDGNLIMGNQRIPCGMGTASMISAAAAVTSFLGIDPPVAIVAGDIGDAAGSRKIYQELITGLHQISPNVLTLHYLPPIMNLMKKVINAAEKCSVMPAIIADAGSMYAVKAGGIARKCCLLTPDFAELKFLADPDAMHPAYICNYFLQSGNNDVEKLVNSAYEHGNSSPYLIVKGSTDYVVHEGKILARVDEPDIPSLEPVGGTGDTITGLITAFMHAGNSPERAGYIATKLNRMAGKYARIEPDSRVHHLIAEFEKILPDYYSFWATGDFS